MYSISLHAGTTISHDHNIRNPKVVDKEKHIDKNGYFETWIDTPIRQAYHDIFDDAVKQYNAKERHVDRRIDDYYTHINKSKQKNVAYECILQVGSADLQPNEPLCREILHDYVDSFIERNPNIHVIGAYYHADEPEGTPHLHLDYIPVAKYNKGLKLRTGLNEALKQQGIEVGSHKNIVHAWQEQERDQLENICLSRKIEITRGITEQGRKHKEQDIYKLERKRDSLIQDVSDLSIIQKADKLGIHEVSDVLEVLEREQQLQERERQLQQEQEQFEQYIQREKTRLRKKEQQLDHEKQQINLEKQQADKLLQQCKSIQIHQDHAIMKAIYDNNLIGDIEKKIVKWAYADKDIRASLIRDLSIMDGGRFLQMNERYAKTVDRLIREAELMYKHDTKDDFTNSFDR